MFRHRHKQPAARSTVDAAVIPATEIHHNIATNCDGEGGHILQQLAATGGSGSCTWTLTTPEARLLTECFLAVDRQIYMQTTHSLCRK